MLERRRDDLAGVDQVSQQTLVDVKIAFVFSAIADVMALRKNTPHLRTDTERVRKRLEHDVSVRGAIPGPAQRREA